MDCLAVFDPSPIHIPASQISICLALLSGPMYLLALVRA